MTIGLGIIIAVAFIGAFFVCLSFTPGEGTSADQAIGAAVVFVIGAVILVIDFFVWLIWLAIN